MESAVQLDVDELINTSQQTITYLESSSWGSQKPIELLSALHDYTRQYIEQGVDLVDVRVTAGEWAVMLRSDLDDTETQRKFVSTHLSKLRHYLDENREAVDLALRGAGCRHRLVINKTASQGQHKVYYYLGLEEISEATGDEEASEVLPSVKPELVRYQVRKIEKPLPWVAPLMELDLEGIKLWLFAGTPIVLALVLIFWGWGIFAFKAYWQLNLYLLFVAVLLLLGWLLSPFYYAVVNRVAIAPDWLIRVRDGTAQLDYRRTDKKRGEVYWVRRLRIVRYQADCPICGAEVNVVKGRHELKGRLVGECSESPLEHVFSFDHMTKIGMPLRSAKGYLEAD